MCLHYVLCIYVCVSMYMYLCMYMCVHVSTYGRNIWIYVCARIYGICVSPFMYFCTGRYVCVHKFRDLFIHVSLHAHIYVSVWMYVCTRVCMNVLRYVVYNGFTCVRYVWIHAMHAYMYTYNAIDGRKHPLIMWVQCWYYSEERCDIPRSECPASR